VSVANITPRFANEEKFDMLLMGYLEIKWKSQRYLSCCVHAVLGKVESSMCRTMRR
jgi:hypothetical protein